MNTPANQTVPISGTPLLVLGTLAVLVIWGFSNNRRMDAIERRLDASDLSVFVQTNTFQARVQALETNWVISDAVLRRAEDVVKRIERDMRKPFPWTTGFVITNLNMTQDAQGNWMVHWPTNRMEKP